MLNKYATSFLVLILISISFVETLKISPRVRSISRDAFLMVYNTKDNINQDFLKQEFKWFDPNPKVTTSPKLFEIPPLPSPGSTIIEIPLFPFDFGVAFPTGEFPLNIFVMHFRQMMNDIQTKGKLFGIVISDGKGAIGEIGTLCENTRQILQEDGRQLCLNTCKQRFRVLEILKMSPYVVAKVEYGIMDEDVIEALDSGSLPPDIASLEFEVWDLLNEVINMTNKLTDSNREPSDILKSLCPANSVNGKNRLDVSSDFSFAVSDMIGVNYIDLQLLLESRFLKQRFLHLKQLLTTAKDYMIKIMEEK